MYIRENPLQDAKCDDCGATYKLRAITIRSKIRDGKKFRCPECVKKIRSQSIQNYNNSLSEEEKKKKYTDASKRKKKYWEEMSTEEKSKRIAKLSKHAKEWHKTASVKEKERISKIHSESNKRRWGNYTDGQKEYYSNLPRERWDAMSDEEKIIWSNKSKQNWFDKPYEELELWKERMSDSKTEYWNNLPNEEYNRICNKISDTLRIRWDNMSKEEKEEYGKQRKEYWDNLSEEDKRHFSKSVSDGLENYWASIPKETRLKMNPNLINGGREYWNNITPELKQINLEKYKESMNKRSEEDINDTKLKMSNIQKNKWKNSSEKEKKEKISQLNNGFIEWYNNLSDEEKYQMSERNKNSSNDYWNNVEPIYKQIRSRKLSENSIKIWNSLSKEERNNRIKILYDAYKNWRNNATNEELSKIAEKNKNNMLNYWSNIDEEKRRSHIHNMISASSGKKNNLHKKFEQAFAESHLPNTLYYKPEFVTSNNGVMHSWDYALFMKDTDELQMVIDLDGAYYHADNCDYDGIHSKEEYDERRPLSVPEGVKHMILPEKNFFRAFDYMIRNVWLSYEEYVRTVFEMCRMIPFPEPQYTDKELISSYKHLLKLDCSNKYQESMSLNTRVGDRIIQHFHPSIYRAHREGELSPYEAWYDDELLIKVIRNRIVYQTYLNPSKILQGFNISKHAQKVSVFSAGRAKKLVARYLSDFDTVFDPFSGFSGRLLGTISNGKKYIGQDINPVHINESRRMVEFLQKYFGNIDVELYERDLMKSSGEYPCLFTCSPYSNKEQWIDMNVIDKTCDEWIDECLDRFKCKRYVFVVDNTEKYKNNVVEYISNKAHMSNNSERVVVINR